MKSRTVSFLAIILVLILSLGAYFGVQFYNYIKPSDIVENEADIYNVSGEDVAMVYNYGIQKATAIYRQGETYLPINWVTAILNDRFYWDDDESLLVYTLADSVLYSDLSTIGISGNNLIIKENDKIYLSLNLIKSYCNINVIGFTDGDIKRIFINDVDASSQIAYAKRDIILRTGNSVKDNIITEVPKLDSVTIIDTDKNDSSSDAEDSSWVQVYTDKGFYGYVQKKFLKDFKIVESKDTYTKPVYTNISMDVSVVMVWHQVTTQGANQGLTNLLDAAGDINVISPTWYSLTDNDGNFNSLANNSYVETAHNRGLKVWALIDNFSQDVNSKVLLSKTSVRKRLIDNLMKEAKIYNFDGYNIDFEALKQDAAVDYIQFIRELSVACRNQGLTLSIDVPTPASFNKYYGRSELGEVADYVISMGYDEHYAGGDMGSVASIEFVREGIEASLIEIPKEKFINAIPFYTRIWKKDTQGTTSSAIGIKNALEWISTNAVELTWDDTLGQYYGELKFDDATQYIWMEEEKSLWLKIDAIKKADIAGVACWKLGLEPYDIWGIVDEVNN